ncbi:hypothetical protein J6TS1_43650 [Siminovitchia terrae]|uniref:Uncharacterized protein n=1 Tax=Siminovitchia terrae TaxID=1914933 RepID=A0ABQ4L2Q3_SIMTE|nr:hypothetical protein [Siminovitchia terrae]GIN93207.1 hypothetical protein J22TS1_42580 [Siminovitchia terrae]GIN98495.1 hypothetical protein J6TS1_43650 [Siminovitchia terrae]
MTPGDIRKNIGDIQNADGQVVCGSLIDLFRIISSFDEQIVPVYHLP